VRGRARGQQGKPIFPIRVREVMPSRSLELFISSAHWIDAWRPPIEKYLARLAQSVTAAAKVYDAGMAGVAPVAPPVAAKARRPPAVAAAAIALLIGGAGWYGYDLLRPGAPPLVAVGEPAAETGSPVAPPARPEGPQIPGAGQVGSAQPQVANLQPSEPVADVGPCPQMLAIDRDLPTPFRCTCGSDAMHGSGAVWGTDVYTTIPACASPRCMPRDRHRGRPGHGAAQRGPAALRRQRTQRRDQVTTSAATQPASGSSRAGPANRRARPGC
jgi:hypothetical protein